MKNTFSSISKAALLTGLMITFLAVSACEDNRMTPDPGIVMDTGNGGHEDDTWVCEPDCSGKVCGAKDG